MAIQTFTAGQVLTAAQVNALQANDYNQTVSTKTASYVLVAADKGTRVQMNSASATTITVNTSLFSAGDTLFIQNIGAGICTITAGTATVSTAGSLALVANAGGTLYFTSAGVSIFFPTVAVSGSQGLTLIKSQVIGSAVSSVNVTGAFSATYDNYKILISSGVGSTSADFNLKLGSSTTDYYATRWGWRLVNTAASFVDANNGSSFIAGAMTTNYINLNCELVNPFLAKYTLFNANFINPDLYASIGGEHRSAASYTDFTLTPGSGTFTGGTIRVYGYSN